MVQSPKTSEGGASLSSKVLHQAMKTGLPMQPQLPAWQGTWQQSQIPFAGLSEEVTDRFSDHARQIQWACYKKRKMEWEDKTGLSPCSTAILKKPTYGCTAMDMPEWKETTEQIDWWEKKQPSQMACVSEDLTCWGAWDITCGTPPVTSHIDRLEERDVGRGSARRSSLKGRGRAIASQTNIGTVAKATLGKRLRHWAERIWAFPRAKILSWTEYLILHISCATMHSNNTQAYSDTIQLFWHCAGTIPSTAILTP